MPTPGMTFGLLAALIAASLPAAEALRVETSRDLWISSHPSEQEGNNGGSPKLKLKGTQEFFLIDFDATKFRGKRVVRATLHLHLEAAPALGRTTVSTVSQEWVEGKGTGYAKVPGATSFRWARTGEARWGGDGKDVTSVILGLSGSTWGFGDSTPPDANRWQVIPIEPAVVQARVDGRSHGFFVMDDVGSEYQRDGDKFTYASFPNRYVASREGKKGTAPFFTLWLEDGPAPKPTTKADPVLPEAKAATLRDPKGTELLSQILLAKRGRIKLHLLLDRSMLDVFGNDGFTWNCAFFKAEQHPQQGIELYAKGGETKLISLDLWPLKSVWK